MTAYDPGKIGFRCMEEDDLPLMHRWLNDGAAFEWYGLEPTTLPEIMLSYAPRLHGKSPVLAMIVIYDGRAIGYIQRYYPREETDFWGRQELPRETAGIEAVAAE